jgi:hypothetical protein
MNFFEPHYHLRHHHQAHLQREAQQHQQVKNRYGWLLLRGTNFYRENCTHNLLTFLQRMTMSFSMYGSRAQGQTESHARRELHHHHHHHAQELASREAKFPSTKTRSLTCQRLNVNRRAPRFGILAAALLLLLHLCLDMNDASSRRRRSSYCHAFQPAGSTSASFHARNRRLSTRPRTTSLSSSASAVEEESVDDNAAFLSDGNFVEETFQERYGSSSSQLPVLPDWLIRKCNECGWTHPPRIQQRALDVICVDKRDAIIQAETGSGELNVMVFSTTICCFRLSSHVRHYERKKSVQCAILILCQHLSHAFVLRLPCSRGTIQGRLLLTYSQRWRALTPVGQLSRPSL